MALTIVNAELCRKLLPMHDCIDVMQEAMQAASQGQAHSPPRAFVSVQDGGDSLGLMPASSGTLGYYGAKIISLHRDNPRKGLPMVQGFVSLFDFEQGQPLAIIAGAEITAIRTAAASGLATRWLAREDARSCGILGTGVQAVTHIEAIRCVRPLQQVLIWGRDQARAQQLAAEQSRATGLDVQAVADPAEAAACDIVCTVTGSPQPILLGEWVQAGAHVNLVGAHTLDTREADSALIAKASLYVDLMESCRNEGGDFMIPIREGLIGEEHIIGEIGQLIDGQIPGRESKQQISVYKSLGVAAQDLFAAQHVYHKAQASGAGSEVIF